VPNQLRDVHWLKVIGKNVYIILQLDKKFKNIGANPTYETDLHQHNTKIRFFMFSIKKFKKSF